MQIIERVIERERIDDTYRLYHLTDLHLGNAFCDEQQIERVVAEIRNDPLALWTGGGDYADFINRKDKRHRESNLARWLHGKDDIAKIQIERLEALLSPIAHKCLALCKGNHEDSILTYSERDVYASLVDVMTRPGRRIRLGFGGYVVIRWRHGTDNRKSARDVWTTTLWLHHCAGGGMLAGSDALTLERLPIWYDFDLAILGHRHRKMVLPLKRTRPSPTAQRIEKPTLYAAFGGSYMELFDEQLETETYAERKMLPPRATGGVVFEFRPAERRIQAIV
jgi:hypothetical protein